MERINKKKGASMRLKLIVVLGIVFFVSQVSAEDKLVLKSQKEKVSYSIGLNIGKKLGDDLKKQLIDIDPNLFTKGIQDALVGAKPLLTDQEIQETMLAFQKEMMAKWEEIGKKNKTDGEAFLAENKKKEGVKTLPDGLEYKVINAGTGKKPKADDTVTVNYRGTLINGTEFDSSYKRGQPATFPVSGGMIKGWSEALQFMQEGAKWELFIPSNLAYGERGMGGIIGPNATLIFEVELVSVKEKTQENKSESKPEKK
jgi:FKBP-type peptidyl-prolyl cis-trans isomerase FklB